MNKKILNIFTINFPYGNAEDFLYNEIKYLAATFEKIYLYPLEGSKEKNNYLLPSNVEVINFKVFEPYNRPKIIFTNFFLIVGIYLTELFKSKNRIKYFTYFLKTLNELTHKISAADRLYVELQRNEATNSVNYTYWFNQWTFILSIINKKYQNNNIYTRIHGMDVYEEQHLEPDFFFQFRSFQLQQIKKVLAISENGKNHLLEANNLEENKVSVSRLGIEDSGLGKEEDLIGLKIVSCSGIQRYKRLHLIVDILMNCKVNIEWLHFGDGELKDELLENVKQLPKNVSFRFMGYKKNRDVLDYYKNNKVDLFINVSETEGIPVSIMEALSFGIPVIATNVGGVSEIVNERNGYLINKNFDSNAICEIIEKYSEKTMTEKRDLKNNARQFWIQNYNANKNYTNLCSELI